MRQWRLYTSAGRFRVGYRGYFNIKWYKTYYAITPLIITWYGQPTIFETKELEHARTVLSSLRKHEKEKEPIWVELSGE